MGWSDHVVTTLILVGIVAGVYVIATDTDISSAVPTDDLERDDPPRDDVTESASQATDDTRDVETFDAAAVERHFISELNSWRTARGLQPVEQSQRLEAVAEGHAADMRRHDYVGHDQPDGDETDDRYRQHGVRCSIDVSGEDYHYDSAEIVTAFYWKDDVRVDWTESGEFKAMTNEELGHALFQEWRHSPPHREIMELEHAKEVALAVKIDRESRSGKVWASADFC